MNEKDGELYRIMDNTIQCCSVLSNEGRAKVTRDLLIGKCRKENVVMVRTMVAMQIFSAGYTVSTIADFLQRAPQSIHHMLDKGYYLSRNSRAYRIAENEATILNKHDHP